MGGQIFTLALAAPQKHGHAKRDQADPGKGKKKTRRAEATGLRSAPTGASSVHLRVLPGQFSAIDAWIAKQQDPDLSRPEARLVELGLKAKTK